MSKKKGMGRISRDKIQTALRTMGFKPTGSSDRSHHTVPWADDRGRVLHPNLVDKDVNFGGLHTLAVEIEGRGIMTAASFKQFVREPYEDGELLIPVEMLMKTNVGGSCLNCLYDLRAKPPRCPTCGKKAPAGLIEEARKAPEPPNWIEEDDMMDQLPAVEQAKKEATMDTTFKVNMQKMNNSGRYENVVLDCKVTAEQLAKLKSKIIDMNEIWTAYAHPKEPQKGLRTPYTRLRNIRGHEKTDEQRSVPLTHVLLDLPLGKGARVDNVSRDSLDLRLLYVRRETSKQPVHQKVEARRAAEAAARVAVSAPQPVQPVEAPKPKPVPALVQAVQASVNGPGPGGGETKIEIVREVKEVFTVVGTIHGKPISFAFATKAEAALKAAELLIEEG